MNRLAVYSYLMRYASGHADFGRLSAEPFPEKAKKGYLTTPEFAMESIQYILWTRTDKATQLATNRWPA